MTMVLITQSTMFDILQAEFSPPLDSSLIAAIIADYVSEDSNAPSSEHLQTCRAVLAQLAAQAEKELQDEVQLSEQLSNAHISSYSVSVTDETCSSADLFSPGNSHTTSSSSSDSSSQYSFSSPLGFLQAAFPHVRTSKLQSELESQDNAEDLDMESVVESLLSSEYVRELEERGLDGLDEADIPDDLDPGWFVVEGKKKSPSKVVKKSKKRGTTFTLVDIRQKQHERAPPTSPRLAAPDPWTQLSSVASYLSNLIPSHPASFFQSAFHSPEYITPAKALRGALRSIASSSGGATVGPDVDLAPEEAPLLFSMLDIINASPEYADLNAEERDQLMADAQLALRATRRQPDTALDIIRQLHELDRDFASGEFEWGVYHSRVPSSSAFGGAGRVARDLPSGPPPVPPPPRRRTPSPSPVNRPRATIPPTNAWKTIPQRQPSGPHPLAESIPAYKRKVRSGGNGLGKGGKGDVGELRGAPSGLIGHRARANELMERRRQALREAGRAWQRGSAKTRGGEVAFYYAEQARGLQQQARQEQLDAAREMVQAKRLTSNNADTLDLHGTTVAEAIQIVKDFLRDGTPSPSKPLRVITGRGIHSVNGVGVLGPAVKSALVDDGWTVGSFDGGLVIRGKSAWRT